MLFFIWFAVRLYYIFGSQFQLFFQYLRVTCVGFRVILFELRMSVVDTWRLTRWRHAWTYRIKHDIMYFIFHQQVERGDVPFVSQTAYAYSAPASTTVSAQCEIQITKWKIHNSSTSGQLLSFTATFRSHQLVRTWWQLWQCGISNHNYDILHPKMISTHVQRWIEPHEGVRMDEKHRIQ